MRTTRKVLLALVLTLCVAAVLSVCAFAAYDLDLDLPAGAVKGDAKWVNSGYTDIDADGSGWVMIGGSIDYSGTTESWPTIAKADFGRFYWNKTTDKGVYVVTANNMSANWEDWSAITVASSSKKMYAKAAAFVDATLGYYGTDVFKRDLSGENVAPDKETSMSVNYSNISKYVVYKRYYGGGSGKAGQCWDSFYVTKASYDAYIAEKTRLEEAGTSGEALEDALVEYVYANFASYKLVRNAKDNGAYVMLAWVFKQLTDAGYVFDVIEFRSNVSEITYSTFGMALKAAEARTILFDSKIVRLDLKEPDRGLFLDIDKLKTFAHVKFNTDGTYTGTITENTIDLSGFTKVVTFTKAYNKVTAERAFGDLLSSSGGIENVIYFKSVKAGDVEWAGVIDAEVFNGNSSLKTVTLTAPLTKIDYQAFASCAALTTIDLKGGVSADATIDSKAFNNVKQKINVYVYSSQDAANATTLFAPFASIINIVKVVSPAEEALIADGFSIRINDTNAKKEGPALRAEFTLSAESVLAAKNETGLGLLDYGIVVFSENTLKNVYDNDIDAIVAAIKAETINPDKVKVVSAANGPYVSVNEETGDKTFAAAITGISAENYDSAVYTYAYAAWSDGSITYTTYTSSREATAGQSAFSLYDATIFAYRNGIVNSQNFVMSTGVELWDILSKGAFTIKDGEQKGFTEGLQPTIQYTLNETTDFTYLDLPLRAWVYYAEKTYDAWDGGGHHVEDTPTTNVLWSILRDGDELVVVYRRDPNAAENAVAALPRITDRDTYSAYAPFSPNYFTPGKIVSWASYKGIVENDLVKGDKTTNGLYKYANLYSPIVSDENAALITAMVVDYGVTSFTKSSLENSTVPNLATIVYPEGVGSKGIVIGYNTTVSEVIYASDTKTSLSEATEGIGKIVDLSGLKSMSLTTAFAGCKKIENVILPETLTLGSYENQYLFSYCSSLKRVWMHGSEVPAEGTLDLTRTGLKTVCKDAFHGLPTNTKILMPESFVGVASYSYQIKEAEACSRTFGADKEYTFVLANENGLINNKSGAYGMVVFYKAIMDSSIASGHKDNLDHITIKLGDVSKSLAEWKAYYDALATE